MRLRFASDQRFTAGHHALHYVAGWSEFTSVRPQPPVPAVPSELLA
ncbi:hypothetical protein [Micromonospora profundi]